MRVWPGAAAREPKDAGRCSASETDSDVLEFRENHRATQSVLSRRQMTIPKHQFENFQCCLVSEHCDHCLRTGTSLSSVLYVQSLYGTAVPNCATDTDSQETHLHFVQLLYGVRSQEIALTNSLSYILCSIRIGRCMESTVGIGIGRWQKNYPSAHL